MAQKFLLRSAFFLCTSSILVWGFASVPIAFAGSADSTEDGDSSAKDKLLIIMLDGFRWDYYDTHKDDLPAFENFISEGVQAEWVEPVFPPDSFPGWTTLSTGVYPEVHGIIGNYMFDLNVKDPTEGVFDLDNLQTTAKQIWWQNVEPIWTTATRYGKDVFLRHWSRCDVPVKEVIPKECTGYTPGGGVEGIRQNIQMGLRKLKEFDLVMVYGEEIDIVGHSYGPNSPEIKQVLIEVDKILLELMDGITAAGLEDQVNIIIVSDHGMTEIGGNPGFKAVDLDSRVDKSSIYRSVGRGAQMSIAPYAKKFHLVYNALKGIEGIDLYKREDIPEEYHYKNGRLVQDILLVAKPKFYIKSLQTTKQIPRDREDRMLTGGSHGFANMTDMRAIFFAKGPAFKKGITHPPIRMEDIYQLYPRILQIPAQPHNGTWSRVSGMLVNKVKEISPPVGTICLSILLAVAVNLIS